MKYLFFCSFILTFYVAVGQPPVPPARYGYRQLQMIYKGDTVDMFLRSKKGEETVPKPLLFWCQGSMAIPLYPYDSTGGALPFPYNTDSLAVYYHLVVVSKPYIPVAVPISSLTSNYVYADSTTLQPPVAYSKRNYLDYYVQRNIQVIKFLQKQPWISKTRLVVAGHSEGSTVAAKMASVYPRITHLIYSGGNPLGRICSIVNNSRQRETDSLPMAEIDVERWKEIVATPEDDDPARGDTHKTTYGFSNPAIYYMKKLKIPVLVSYGSKDVSVAANDFFRIDMIRRHKQNFLFKAYIGTEHNYFPVRKDGSVNWDIFNWDKVGMDWFHWLRTH